MRVRLRRKYPRRAMNLSLVLSIASVSFVNTSQKSKSLTNTVFTSRKASMPNTTKTELSPTHLALDKTHFEPKQQLLEEQWREEQNELKKLLIRKDDKNQSLDGIQYIGGCDISFFKGNNVDAVATMVVVRLPDLEVVYESYRMVKLTQPYIAGYLAFREVDHLSQLVEDLRANKPEIFPDLIMVDGNGMLHPRSFGVACHLGVVADVPTIGVGKSLLVVDGMDAKKVKAQAIEDRKNGKDHTILRGKSGKVWGAAVVRQGQAKPVYVSVGHKISLESAVRLVQRCQTTRIPEPIRQADLRSREYVRKIIENASRKIPCYYVAKKLSTTKAAVKGKNG